MNTTTVATLEAERDALRKSNADQTALMSRVNEELRIAKSDLAAARLDLVRLRSEADTERADGAGRHQRIVEVWRGVDVGVTSFGLILCVCVCVCVVGKTV